MSHTNDHYSSQTRPGPKPESQHSRGFLHARNPAAKAVQAPSLAWTRATSVAVCCTSRSKGSSSPLQTPGSFSPWKLRRIAPTVQSPASRGEKENDSGQTHKTQRCSLVKGFLYFVLLDVLTLLKLCTYTSVLHRSENLSCFFPSPLGGSQLPFFLLSHQLAQRPNFINCFFSIPMPSTSAQENDLPGTASCVLPPGRSLSSAACPEQECEA